MFEFLLSDHLPDSTLLRYRVGALDRESVDVLEEHLVLCPTCQLQLGDLMEVLGPAEVAIGGAVR